MAGTCLTPGTRPALADFSRVRSSQVELPSDSGAKVLAAANGAELAVRRRNMSRDHPWSLSPAPLASASFTPRLVLPSPNGSVIAATARGVVVAACLRNAAAAATWALQHGYDTVERPVAVIASRRTVA
jgi:2-phosphosulfolactate phosphatase